MKVLRYPQLRELVGFSRMHLGRLEAAGRFPKRVRLGPNTVAWVEAEVQNWLERRAAERDQPAGDPKMAEPATAQ